MQTRAQARKRTYPSVCTGLQVVPSRFCVMRKSYQKEAMASSPLQERRAGHRVAVR
jgi:hypothetical protein